MKSILGLIAKISAIILVIVSIAIVSYSISDGKEGYRIAKIYEVNGNVTVVKGGIEYRPYAGMSIQEGTVIVTSAGSDVGMLLDDDKYVKLESGSRMTFEKLDSLGNGNATMKLERGSVTSEIVKPLQVEEQFVVNTPNAILAVRGTYFRVDISRNKDGDTETDIYTYGGTVASNRILPNGEIVEEDVLIKYGYKAKINMNDKDTIYVLDEVNGEKTQPISIDDISDEELVDIYFAAKNGHKMFIEMGEIEKNITLRNIDIDNYKSKYDKARRFINLKGITTPDDSRPLIEEKNKDDTITSVYGAPYDGAHKHKEVRTTIEATCLEDGLTTLTCETCGMIVQEVVIEATGHTDGEAEETSSATCTQTGMMTTKCTICEAITKEEVIPMLSHKQVTNTIPATCTEKGMEKVACSDCGLVFSETELPATGHIETNGGVSECHTKCGGCGITLSTEHTYSEEQTKAPTCTEAGELTHFCTCGYSYITEIEATGHTEVKGGTRDAHTKCDVCGMALSTEHAYTSEQIKAPTCTEVGEKTHTCDCGYSYVTDIVETGHIEVNGGAKDAHSICSVCSEILSTEHTYSEEQTKAPTCTAKGEKTHTCECGYKYTSVVAAKGHTEAKGGTESIHSKCSVCDVVLSSTHSYSTNQTITPTCKEKGEEKHTCECGYSYTSELSAKGHIKATNNSVSECLGCGDKIVDLSSENFPDAVFLGYLQSEGYDTDNDGMLLEDEIATITSIDVSYQDTISSLTGLEHLTSVTSIDCTGLPSLIELDTAGLTQLNSINVSKTGIKQIICNSETGNTNLQNVSANDCISLTKIDVGGTNVNVLNTSGSSYVSSIDAAGTAFTSFDTSGYPDLTTLDLSGTSINSLDVTSNGKLTSVDVSNCASLDSADMSGLTHLSAIDVNNCLSLKTLDISDTSYADNTPFSGLSAIEELYASNTYLMEIPLVLPSATLKVLQMDNSTIQKADLSDCTSLQSVSLQNAELTEALYKNVPNLKTVDMSGCANLEVTRVTGGNVLTTFDISVCNKLEQIEIQDCPIYSDLTVTDSPLLYVVKLGGSGIQNLTVSGLTGEELSIEDGDTTSTITNINVSGNTTLKNLILGSYAKNLITTLNMNGCTSLENLDISACKKLQWLDVSKTAVAEINVTTSYPLNTLIMANCPNLITLDYMNNSKLEFLDVGGSTNLSTLDLEGCEYLTDLNIAGCTGINNLTLKELELLDNIDLSGLSNLKTLNVESLPISDVDITDCVMLESITLVSCENIIGVMLSGKTNLKEIDLRCPSLTEVYLSGCTGLTGSMRLPGSPVKIFDVSGCTGLTALELYYDQGLVSLDVSNTNLTSLDISTHPDLTSLNVKGASQLTEINANGCISLQNFQLTGVNELVTLDLRQCSSIVSVDVNGKTKLENLYLEGCSNMTSLNISASTKLSTVDVSSCGALGSFSASGCTGLTSLDLTGRTQLTSLNLNGCANLKSLNLAECYMLNNLQVQNCELACIDLSDVTGTINNFEYANTTRHTVSTEADGITIDIATQFPANFDASKASWRTGTTGVTYDSVTNTLTIDPVITTDTFTYAYDCGNSCTLEVTVTIN